MAELHKTTCCGVRQFIGLEELDTPKEVLMTAGKLWFSWKGAFILFTAPLKSKKAQALIDYINEEDIGTIKEGPNSSTIRFFSFCVAKERFKKWAAEATGLEKGDEVTLSSKAKGSYYYNDHTYKVVKFEGCNVFCLDTINQRDYIFPYDQLTKVIK